MFSQEYPYIGWNSILLDRTTEDLHNVFSQEKDEEERETLHKYLLVTEDGGVFDNVYFDTETYEYIAPYTYLKRGFFDKRFLKKLLKQTKKTHLFFWKTKISHIGGYVYITFDECFATRSKEHEGGVLIKKDKTYAIYIYKFDKEKGDFILDKKEIFGIKLK